MSLKYFVLTIGAISSALSTAHADTIHSNEIYTNLKWSWNQSQFEPSSVQVMATPVVAQLNDDNSDNIIDNNDVADVIIITFKNKDYAKGGIIRALSGTDGAELWAYNNGAIIADARYSPAVADLDGDGVVEIVTTSSSSNFINILDVDGNIKKQIPKVESGWRSVGDISLADLDGDTSIEILSANAVYNYDTGLVFSHPWAPSSISGDFNGDSRAEVFTGGALYQSNGSFDWQYQANDTVWFSSLVNLDDDKQPEVIVSVPATYNSAENSVFTVLEHDGTTKWEVTNLENSGGGVQAVSNFLGRETPITTSLSKIFGYADYHSSPLATITIEESDKLWIRSGAAIDAIGTAPSSVVGGNGGYLNSPIDLSQVEAIDITSGRYWWGGYHVLALDFYLKDGSQVSIGSKRYYSHHIKTERVTVPHNSFIKSINVWTSYWLVDGLQFQIASVPDNHDIKGIVYAGYSAVDMYNFKGEKVWSVPNDDINSGKIGVSAFDFDNDGIDEVLVQDRQTVRILDGQTGRILSSIDNSSGTLWEYPIVVDLAGDDNAELIVVANDYDRPYAINHGVYVYESADDDKPWKNATRIWNQHSYHFSNISQDGSIPSSATSSWLTHNTYRSSTLRGVVNNTKSPIFGRQAGEISNHHVLNDQTLFVRSGFAIDALGTSLDHLAGGDGGALRSPVNLAQVESIQVTSGDYYWGGNHIIALKFTFKNGSSILMGSKHYASNKVVETFTIPQGTQIQQMNVWTNGWLVDGLQFELN